MAETIVHENQKKIMWMWLKVLAEGSTTLQHFVVLRHPRREHADRAANKVFLLQ